MSESASRPVFRGTGLPETSPARGAPRLMIVSDAWRPQINGVARTVEMLSTEIEALGVEIDLLTPEGRRTVAMPGYPEIRLALTTPGDVGRAIDAAAPDAVHISTEGPLGLLARRHCLARGRRFTTCYHTRFPEYVAARSPTPLSWSYGALRWFHGAAAATMVSSHALRAELESWGFRNLVVWRRGVDVRPFLEAEPADLDLPRPIFLNVGRVAVEKNLDAFLSLRLPGSKVVVGDGPARAELEARYPDAIFLGKKTGAELASIYAAADVFVFPSRTDTFGLVMLEALAAGTPVAAFDVTGPREALGRSGCGVLGDDLRASALAALRIERARCSAFGADQTMRASATSFLHNIAAALARPDLAHGCRQGAAAQLPLSASA